MDAPATRRSFVLAAGALAACAPAPKTARRTVRIGYQKNGVLLLAKARGRLPGRLAAAGATRVEWAQFRATSLRRGPLAVAPLTDAVVKTQQANADIFRRLGVIPSAVDVSAAAWTGWTPAQPHRDQASS